MRLFIVPDNIQDPRLITLLLGLNLSPGLDHVEEHLVGILLRHLWKFSPLSNKFRDRAVLFYTFLLCIRDTFRPVAPLSLLYHEFVDLLLSFPQILWDAQTDIKIFFDRMRGSRSILNKEITILVTHI